MKENEQIDDLNLITLAQEYADEDKARELLESMLWPDGPIGKWYEGTGHTNNWTALLNLKPRMFRGAERESVSKKRKPKKKQPDVMMPNLSGVKFEDALKALLKTPASKEQLEKHAKESLDKSIAEAKTRFQKP